MNRRRFLAALGAAIAAVPFLPDPRYAWRGEG